MAVQKENFFDVVAKLTTFQSQSGHINKLDAKRWVLRDQSINFDLLVDATTKDFLDELKHKCAMLINAQSHADGSICAFFLALKDCIHFAYRGTGEQAGALTSDMIIQWRNEASSASYPEMLKHFILAVRCHDPQAFPKVAIKVLKGLRNRAADVKQVLTLDPKTGPWLECEVLDQDRALEHAFTSGSWHVEKFVFVQLFRFYGMRPEQVANMKVGDIRCRVTGYPKNEIRWPYAKNDVSIDKAPWWPLGGSLLPAMNAYLELRLDGIPRCAHEVLPLFIPGGLPGVFRNVVEITKINMERGFEGHALPREMIARYNRLMESLGLKTFRNGQCEPMHFNTRRERHTVATRLALKGYSAQQIALRLSHKSPDSCSAYVDLARMAMQMRNPKFYHLMENVGSVFTNPVVTRIEIEQSLTPIISVEATTTAEVALIGGGSCGNCIFAGESTSGEPWPCLSCPKFQLYEDADIQPLWDILHERRSFMQHSDGSWNNRFDPDIRAQFNRYQALLLGAERRRREVVKQRSSDMKGLG